MIMARGPSLLACPTFVRPLRGINRSSTARGLPARDVGAGLALIAPGHEERRAEDFRGPGHSPAVRIVGRKPGLRE
jgi:hypothetical protein